MSVMPPTAVAASELGGGWRGQIGGKPVILWAYDAAGPWVWAGEFLLSDGRVARCHQGDPGYLVRPVRFGRTVPEVLAALEKLVPKLTWAKR